MIAIIQEIGVIQSVIIAACLGFMIGMLVVFLGERIKLSYLSKDKEWKRLAMIPIKNRAGYPSTYIESIKECRRVRGIGLKDAKEMVDKWIASNAKI